MGTFLLLEISGHAPPAMIRPARLPDGLRKIMTRLMPAGALTIRPGDEADGPTVVALFDEAVAWLVDRGQTGQWGMTPFSERPGIRERVHGFRIGGGLYIAERDNVPVGVLVVGPAPAYAPPAPVPELYVILLLSSRQSAGQGIGDQLISKAVELGYERGAEILRVDCWAHAPGLVRWYEKQGFSRSSRFELNGWQGQIFTMQL
jgi:GNAT superfamily N-acetyltransferase